MKKFLNLKEKSEFFKHLTIKHIIVIVILILIFVIISGPQFSVIEIPKLNSIAEKDYFSKKDLKFVDENKTKKIIDEKTKKIIPIFYFDKTVKFSDNNFVFAKNIINNNVLKELFEAIINNGYFNDTVPYDNQLMVAIQYKKYIENSDKIIRTQVIEPVEKNTIIFGPDNLHNFIKNFFESKKIDFDNTIIKLFVDFFQNNPNVKFDYKYYNKEKEFILKTTPPYVTTIKKGGLIIKKGEQINHSHIQILKEYFYLNIETNIKVFIGLLFLFCVILFFYYLFMFMHYRNVFLNINKFIISSLLILLPAIILKVFLFYMLNPEYINKINQSVFIIPFPAFALLAAIFVSIRFAIIHTFISSIIITLIYSFSLINYSDFFNYFNFLFFLTMFISSSFGIISYINIRNRLHLIRAGMFIGISGALVILFFNFAAVNIKSNYSNIHLLAYISILLNGFLLTPIITIGLLPFFENIFKISTDYKLLEISDLNLPIFKELMVNAPGTYHHSITIGNLCENAAEVLKLNPLLVRAGGYYHDIGKLNKAGYFIENITYTNENLHDKIKPSLSSSIIKSHIKIGVEMAKELKLPIEIIDIIQQHHGTSLIKIFYKKALETASLDEVILEEDYRYPGPKPQTKEAALVMLADVCEAACRSLTPPTPQKIEETINNCIESKIEEGELDECDLTLKELNIIKNIFIKLLTNIFLSRIKYPDDNEIKKLEQRRNE